MGIPTEYIEVVLLETILAEFPLSFQTEVWDVLAEDFHFKKIEACHLITILRGPNICRYLRKAYRTYEFADDAEDISLENILAEIDDENVLVAFSS